MLFLILFPVLIGIIFAVRRRSAPLLRATRPALAAGFAVGICSWSLFVMSEWQDGPYVWLAAILSVLLVGLIFGAVSFGFAAVAFLSARRFFSKHT